MASIIEHRKSSYVYVAMLQGVIASYMVKNATEFSVLSGFICIPYVGAKHYLYNNLSPNALRQKLSVHVRLSAIAKNSCKSRSEDLLT